MSSFHYRMKSGKRGRAAKNIQYITREGPYARTAEETDLVAVHTANLPLFANGSALVFGSAADKYERKNGAAYKEVVVSLPRELSLEENVKLAMEFAQMKCGAKPHHLAVHNPKGAIGGVDHPHAHLVFSDRVPDGIERGPEQFFKRYNPKSPEKGGCRKDSGGRSPSVLAAELKEDRKMWADLQNAYLERNGHDVRVDARSFRERGLTHQPELPLPIYAIQLMSDAEKEAHRARRKRGPGGQPA